MKTTEENRTMNSGDRREPGDVYMMLSPEGKTQAVSANGRYYKNFGHFINHCTYEGENETYIEASAENSGSTLYDKEIRDKPRTRHTKRNV